MNPVRMKCDTALIPIGVVMTDTDQKRASDPATQPLSEVVRSVVDALNSLRFGAIQLTVHDGKLVQVDITECKRFNG
jgi:hypothetical protein